MGNLVCKTGLACYDSLRKTQENRKQQKAQDFWQKNIFCEMPCLSPSSFTAFSYHISPEKQFLSDIEIQVNKG